MHKSIADVVALGVLALAGAGLARGGERAGVYGSGWEFGDGGCWHCRALWEAQEAGSAAYEVGTGKDLRNYAPDRLVDFLHMRLEVDIPDMETPRLTAKQTLSFAPIARALEALTLDAEQMDIRSVSMAGGAAAEHSVSFSYDDRRLALRFTPPLLPGREAKVVVEYALNDPPNGLVWLTSAKEWPGRAPQIHTQGQPNTNRFWFPAHDFPNERLTTEIIATAPEGFVVSANGREASPARTEKGRTTFHWLQDKPHVAYLVSMIVGKFDIADVGDGRLPMPVYVPPGKKGWIGQTYGRTAEMMRVFEERFGEPYPWDRYAQLVVWNFGAGGMENTSATTMYDTAILDEKSLADGDLDGLIAHELAHQWFGDLLTCNTWAHIWLNEGWATYASGLWYERRDGYQDGYLAYMHRTMRGLAQRDQLKPESGASRPAMVSRVYEHPWEVFRRVSNPYPKGASVLHMLRMRLGDRVFFDAVAKYVDRYKFKTVETDDFRRTLEEASGLSLEQFFEQWTQRPGTPKVAVRAKWDQRRNELTLTLRQEQRIDAEHPAFAFDLPIEIHLGPSGSAAPEEPLRAMMRVDGAFHERTFSLPSEPVMALIDPDLHVLMNLTVDAPRQWLANQLHEAPSVASRLDAAAFLARKNGPATTSALAATLGNPDEHHAVRSAAARTLAELSEGATLVQMLRAGIEDARVRLAVIESATKVGGEEVVAALAEHAADAKESYACRAAALEGLGRTGGAAHFDVIAAGLKVESQHDRVRSGAIAGMRWVNTKAALHAVIPYTKFGHLSRTRPEAIGAIAKLAEHDRNAAYETVAPLLFDREARTRTAAGAALVEINEPRGLAELDRLIATTRDHAERARAEGWRAQLAAAIRGDEALHANGAELERLKADVKRLESKLKSVEEK